MSVEQIHCEKPEQAVLVIDPDLSNWQALSSLLKRYFGLVELARNVEHASALFQRFNFNLCIIELDVVDEFESLFPDVNQSVHPETKATQLSDAKGSSPINATIESAYLTFPQQFIVISQSLTSEDILYAMRKGACDFIAKPIETVEVNAVISRWLLQRSSVASTSIVDTLTLDTQTNSHNSAFSLYIGDSVAIKQVKRTLNIISSTGNALLLEGEVGTGKKLAVSQLQQSLCSPSHFMMIDCRAPSELDAKKLGLYCANTSQTNWLVFNHIAELPMDKQVELLIVLDSIKLNEYQHVRLVSMSTARLFSRVQRGEFLVELYYRLAEFIVSLPPLRQRPEDIVMLTKFFINRCLIQHKSSRKALLNDYSKWGISDFQCLTDYYWPGNIQELKNTIEQCFLLNIAPKEYLQQLPETSNLLSANQIDTPHSSLGQHYLPIDWDLQSIEKAHIIRVIEQYNGNKVLAAEHLGVSRKTVDRKVKEWELD
ncbi:sigma-54-dependent Fis family transcriptional regulator [Shewanella algicola]|uniref:Sigma 54-interacting transcriptional regulator n=1 Tax=Shewanella algicola TaxID=640633 RepID=A0A9X1Z431_9GAMM|nr:sigma 54-interacting transcriptional regulator [Shewanella algicola]MCL1104883.1 sigma 54-interacting transcriptional regulator [Shewanella algicola]GGP46691.1 sigma-54-dependent Fis family transcriptional regulator [Shewanella algicola]